MSIVIHLITILTVQDGAVIGYLAPSFILLIGGSIPITVGALTVGTVLTLVRHPDPTFQLCHLHAASKWSTPWNEQGFRPITP